MQKAKEAKVKALLISSGILAALAGLGWVGLQIRPAPFPAVEQPSPPLERIPLPAGLPAPVERFYRQIYGENIPVITSAVISGRGTMRLSGLTFPVRFRITHQAGQGYHHYFETTFFGLPVMKVNETYVDGQTRMELPFGVVENEPKVDQAANLALWAESLVWLPAILVTDPRLRWQPVDEATALLIAPFGQAEERFVVRFDPESGLPRLVEAMRYRNPDSPAKTLWLSEARQWARLNGPVIGAVASLTWLDEGTPWAVFKVEEALYNVAVEVSPEKKGL